MITILFSILTIVQGTYFAEYSRDAEDAVAFFANNSAAFRRVFNGASEDDIRVAYSIVAPEVSQYDAVSDFMEVAALEIKYVRGGNCDYSIGYFQMKPSFVESLEKEVFKSRKLTAKYGELLKYSKGKNRRKVRQERLDRLSDTEWQIRFLAIFVDVVKERTAGWNLKNNNEKVRYWATLYNAGFYLSRSRVEQRQGVKQFPRNTKKFNYSAVAVEFYNALSGR